MGPFEIDLIGHLDFDNLPVPLVLLFDVVAEQLDVVLANRRSESKPAEQTELLRRFGGVGGGWLGGVDVRDHADPPLTLRSFWHDLPREGQLLLSVVVFEFLGTGLVLPFLVVYLHEIRGFSLSDVGLLIGLGPLIGLRSSSAPAAPSSTATAPAGHARLAVLLIVGDVVLAFAPTLPLAVLAVVLQGVAFGVSWPASQSLIAAAVPSELRQRYFGVNFTLLNLGIGIGGIVGGLFVDVAPTRSPSRRSTSPTRSASCRSLFLLLRPAAPPGRATGPRRRRAAGDRVLPPGAASPAVALVMLLSFVSVVRRLRPAQRRHSRPSPARSVRSRPRASASPTPATPS